MRQVEGLGQNTTTTGKTKEMLFLLLGDSTFIFFFGILEILNKLAITTKTETAILHAKLKQLEHSSATMNATMGQHQLETALKIAAVLLEETSSLKETSDAKGIIALAVDVSLDPVQPPLKDPPTPDNVNKHSRY